ncbi:MAG TPA: pitrilysin family protein [Candidatus Acidoferrales bacterium]|nr:pitrilysin family protein [Candidatus Acidoferrales bacterium]
MSAPVTTAPAANSAAKQAPPALGAERTVAWPRRAVRTLANGMQVVLVEAHTFPKISAQLFFRAGNSVGLRVAPGIADMTSAVVRTGTASRASRQIEEDLRRMGANLGTQAGADSSAISVSGLAEFAPGLFELVADLARNATFPADEFERERRQRLEELRIERTTPGFLAGERLRRVLFGDDPYATIAPTEAQVLGYKRENLEKFYHRNFTPSGALLIVVGDFSSEEMFVLVEKIFGAWKAPEPEAPAAAEPPRHSGRHVHLVHLPGTVQTQIAIGNLAITRRDPDWYRYVLANSIYGGAFHSRLVINIREQKGYTYSPRSSVNALRRHGYFSVNAAVRNDVVAASLTEIFYELDRIRSLPVTSEELESARNYISGVFSLGVATQEGLLGQLATAFLDRLPENYLETYRDRIRALTAADVLAAARRHFDSAAAQIVIVGDRAQIGEQAALFGKVTEYDANGK